MEGYLGETIVQQRHSEFKDYDKTQWALYFINEYGSIDGAHHKDWVIDQVVRILMNTPVVIKIGEWKNGTSEYRVSLGKPSFEYLSMVKKDINYEMGIAQ